MNYSVKDLNGTFRTNNLDAAIEHAKHNAGMASSWWISGWWEDAMAQVVCVETGNGVFDAEKWYEEETQKLLAYGANQV